MPGKRIRRAMLILGIPAMLVCVSGGNCSGLSFVLPVEGGGFIEFNTVTLELFNATLFPVEPRLFIDVEDDSLDVDDDANRMFLDAPIAPGEVVVLTLACADVGAIETDHALMLLPLQENIESDNDPTVRRHDEFDCGDTVRFTFFDEPGEDFRTFVEVNGRDVD